MLSHRIAVTPWLGGVEMGLRLTGKLGCAWVGAWVVHGWCMGGGDVADLVGVGSSDIWSAYHLFVEEK